MVGSYTCEDLKAAYDQSVFQIKEGRLFYQNVEVGSITDTSFEVSTKDPEDGSTFTLHLDRTVNGVNYHEQWEQAGVVQMTVLGALKNH